MKGILSKLWIAITSLVLIILLITWIFQVGLLKRFYINERTSILAYEANKIASLMVQPQDQEIIRKKVLEEIETFTSSINARVLVFDNEGAEMFYNNYNIIGRRPSHINGQNTLIRNILKDEDIQSIIDEKISIAIPKIPNRDSFIIINEPVIKDNEKIANIVIFSPIASIEEAILILKKQLSVISIFSLGIGTLLALSLSKYFIKPILNIIDVSKQISKGDYTAKVTHKSKDEIGTLGETVNDMAKQLDKIEQFRKELVSNISHELKTPITLIKVYAELIKEVEDIHEEDKNQYLEVITEESDRLNNMIEDILYLSKMQAGYTSLVYQSVVLNEMISSIREKLSYFASNNNIEFNVETNNKNIFIYVDKDKMYQVFYNIIYNAIQHSYNKGKIIVKAFNIDSVIRIEIIDNGKGIPEDDLPYIWERFYKVDKSGKRNDSGTGLGMSIVKNILEAHHFKYGIESQLNKGTTVWIEVHDNDQNNERSR